MPYKARGKCVYRADTGKKVGCTKGSVKKYLAALHANVHHEQKNAKITQKDIIKGIRKPSAPPTKVEKSKKAYDRKDYKKFDSIYETFLDTLGSAQRVTDTQDSAAVGETMYSDGQDETQPSMQPLADEVDSTQLIRDVIQDLEELQTSHDWSKPLEDSLIKAMADSLRDAGVEPTDIDAAMHAPVEQQKDLLFNRALRDLKEILAKQSISEDESDPGADLPAGTSDSVGMADLRESAYKVGQVMLSNPFGTGRKYYPGVDRIVADSEDDALRKYLDMVIRKYGIRISPALLYRDAQKNGVNITALTTTPEKPTEFWWQKD